MKASAAVTRELDAQFEIVEADIDDPRPDEALVRIEAVGICHTDLAARAGQMPVPFPIVLGHEGCGVVESIGSAVTTVAVGDRVALSSLYCGHCRNCVAGRRVYCELFGPLNFGGTRLDGSRAYHVRGEPVNSFFVGQSSFGSYALVAERSLVKLPQQLPASVAGPLSCGVMTGAGAIIKALTPPAGSSVVVFGTGPVGMSAVLAAHVIGAAAIIAVEPNPERRKLALELGATHTLDPADGDVVDAIRQITGPAGAHYSLDTTGQTRVVRDAVECLVPTGECGLLAVPSPVGAQVELDMISVVSFGRRVRGIVFGDATAQLFIPELIDLYQQGRFPVDRLVTTFPFAQINDAAQASASGEVIKAVLTFQNEETAATS